MDLVLLDFRLAFIAWLLSPTLDNFEPRVQIPQEQEFSWLKNLFYKVVVVVFSLENFSGKTCVLSINCCGPMRFK